MTLCPPCPPQSGDPGHQLVEEEIWRKERENGRIVNEPFEVKRSSERSEFFLVGAGSWEWWGTGSVLACLCRGVLPVVAVADLAHQSLSCLASESS